jgi:hypothetical protein
MDRRLTLEPLSRIGLKERRLGLKDFDPCSILLNNDLSAGVPEILKNIHEQYVLPLFTQVGVLVENRNTLLVTTMS